MDFSLAALLPRMFISMAIVILVMYVAARVLKNRQVPGVVRAAGKAGSKPAVVQVLGRQGLGKNAAVTVVRTGDKTLVIGVTDTNISLLAELPSTEEKVEEVAVASSQNTQWTGVPDSLASLPSSDQAWKGLLEQVRERTVRRA